MFSTIITQEKGLPGLTLKHGKMSGVGPATQNILRFVYNAKREESKCNHG
jgi:hypothetical protein